MSPGIFAAAKVLPESEKRVENVQPKECEGKKVSFKGEENERSVLGKLSVEDFFFFLGRGKGVYLLGEKLIRDFFLESFQSKGVVYR